MATGKVYRDCPKLVDAASGRAQNLVAQNQKRTRVLKVLLVARYPTLLLCK
jgi:hypothetical protein